MSRMACVALLCIGCAAGSSEPEKQGTKACEQLREHVIDVRVSEIQQDREAHREALRQALGRSYVTTCLEEPRERFECEMKATDIDGIRNCSSAGRR